MAVAVFMVTLNEKLSLKEDSIYVPPTDNHIFLYSKCNNDMISHSISKKMVMTLKSATAEVVLISSTICP